MAMLCGPVVMLARKRGPAPVPVNTSLPAITGNPWVGHTLSASNGSWTNSPTSYSYQWLKNGVNISGATANTFLVTLSEYGNDVSCVVTATNANGSGYAESISVEIVDQPYAFKNLAALFNGGAVDGIMIDLTNKDTLFQDANGAAAVVNNGDPVGLALDQHKWGGLTLAAYRAAQPELMTNGDFANGLTGWTASLAGNVSTVDGAIRITLNSATPRYAYQVVTTVVGRWYEVSFDYIGGTSTVAVLYVGTIPGGGNIITSAPLSVGTKRYFFKATTTTTHIQVVNQGASGSTADFDNISVKEIDGHHATQAGTARPLWQTAKSDVLFDGSNDYLATEFYPQSNNNFLSSWGLLALASGTFTIMGSLDTSPSAFATLVGAAGKANSNIGTAGGPSSGATDIYNRYATMMATQTAALATLYVDGVSDSTKATPGDLPDITDAVPIAIGARNQNGTINSFWNGRIKRIVAAQIDLAATSMSAADFHQNLIVSYAPVIAVAPVISGAQYVGKTLTTDNGSWLYEPTTFTYQWRKNGVPISGQTGSTYVVVSGDLGAEIDCLVTASNIHGSASSDSNNIMILAHAWANLAALFNGGAVDGIMIDLTDKTTLFQDANGAAAVVNNADPVGLALDQHKWGGLSLAAYRAAQPELITNGNFDTDISGWTSASGNLTWVSGRARITATGSGTPYFSRTITTVSGKWYELSADLVTDVGSAGVIQIAAGTSAGGGTMLASIVTTLVGTTIRRFFKATATTVYISLLSRTGSGNYTEWDNVSVKEIDGHHATQASTARPLWQSATNDVLFDGSNDYLSVPDFDFPVGDCNAALWVKSSVDGKYIFGAASSNSFRMLHTGGLVRGLVGPSGSAYSTTTITGLYKSILVDKQTAKFEVAIDGVVEATTASPGSTAVTIDSVIGGTNNSGTPGQFMTGNVKRIVAGQFRVQDTMNADDFHANLIAA